MKMINRNWELLAPWQEAKIVVPTKYIIGDRDIGFEAFGMKDYVKGDVFQSFVPNLEVAIIPDGHHFIHQEKPQQISEEILSFLRSQSVDS